MTVFYFSNIIEMDCITKSHIYEIKQYNEITFFIEEIEYTKNNSNVRINKPILCTFKKFNFDLQRKNINCYIIDRNDNAIEFINYINYNRIKMKDIFIFTNESNRHLYKKHYPKAIYTYQKYNELLIFDMIENILTVYSI